MLTDAEYEQAKRKEEEAKRKEAEDRLRAAEAEIAEMRKRFNESSQDE